MTEIRIGEYVFTLALDGDGKPMYAHTVVPPFPAQIIQADVAESSLPPELTPYSYRTLSGGYGQAETPLSGENSRFDRMGDAAGEGVDATLTPEGPVILAPLLETPTLSSAGTQPFIGVLRKSETVSYFTVGRYVYVWQGGAATLSGDLGAGAVPSDRMVQYRDVTGTNYYYQALGSAAVPQYSLDAMTWTNLTTTGGVNNVVSFLPIDGAVQFAYTGVRGTASAVAQFDDGGTNPTAFGVIDPIGNPIIPITRLMNFSGRTIVLKDFEGLFLLTNDRFSLEQNYFDDLGLNSRQLYSLGATVWRGILFLPTGTGVMAITPGFSGRPVGPDVRGMSIQAGVHGVIQAVAGDDHNLYAFLYTGTTTPSWLLKANVKVEGSAVADIAWFPLLQLGNGLQCKTMAVAGNSGSAGALDLLIGQTTGSTYLVYRIRLPSQGRDPRADSAYRYAAGGTLYYSRNTKRFPANPAQWYGITPLCYDLGYKVDQITPTTAQSIATWYKEDTVPLVATPPYGYTQNTAQTTGVGTRDVLTDLTAPRSVRARGLDTALRLASSDNTTTPQVSSVTLDYMLSPAPTWQHTFTIDLSSGAQETGGLGGLGALLPPDRALQIVRQLPGTATTLAMAPDQPDITYSVAIPPNDGVVPEVSGPPDAGYGGPGGMASVVPFRFTIRALETTPVNRTVDTQRSYLQEVMADAPGGYWRLGETSGTAAADSAGHSNTGTYTGGYTLNQPGALTGDSNAATLFNGTTGYVAVPSSATLSTGDTISIEFWLKRTAIAGAGVQERFVSKGVATDGYEAWMINNLVVLGVFGVANMGNLTTPITDVGVWHHIVLTHAPGTFAAYLDGVEATTLIAPSTVITNNTTALALGALSAGGGSFLNGQLDEVAIYPTVLSAARVAAHYQAGTTVR